MSDNSGAAPAPISAWDDWNRGVEFLRGRLQHYADKGFIRPDQLPKLNAHYEAVRAEAAQMQAAGATFYSKTLLVSPSNCWNCGIPVAEGNYCPRCGSVQHDAEGDNVRYLNFLLRTGQRLHREGLLDLHQVHGIENGVQREIAATKTRLVNKRLSGVELFKLRREAGLKPEPPPMPAGTTGAIPPPLPPKRSVLEVLLDPQSIQWLLASGGLLLVVGIVIYLASVGLFKNPVFMAILMGVGNVAVLVAGWGLLLKTRFHTAGRAITLLACLAMPLNLWFYHVQGLMTLDGHLWVPATLICLFYAASARVLRDPLFIYVMMGGITLTGLLILVDLHKFMEIATPSMMLMALALICIHVERVFTPIEETPFSRKRFGLAFFFSGQALIAGALGLLLGAQIVGWLWEPIFHNFFSVKPEIATDTSLKVLGLVVVIAAAYAWIYSTLVVRRKGVYAYFAAATVLWAQVMIIDIWAVDVGASTIILAMSGTALLAIVGQKLIGEEHEMSRALRTLGVLLLLVSTWLAVMCHFRATWTGLHMVWPYEITGWTIVAMLTTAIVARLGAAFSLPRHTQTAAAYFFCSAAALLVAVAGMLSVWGLKEWNIQATLLILVPIGYLIAARLYGQHASARPALMVAQIAMAVVIISAFFSAVHIAPHIFEPIEGDSVNLWVALIALEAAIFYALLGAWFQKTYATYLSAILVCASLWQVFTYFHLPAHVVVNAYALLGLGLLVVYRLAVMDDIKRYGLTMAAFVCGNGLVSLAMVISVLMTLGDFVGNRIGTPQLALTSGLTIILAIAAMLTRHSAWRRFHVMGVAIEAAMAVICLQKQLNLSAWQNIELFLVVAGIITLICAHLTLLRQREPGSDIVGLGMPMGSLMVCLPLAAGMFYFRFFTNELSMMDEIGLITASILLFVSGVMFKVRGTTLVGGFFGVLHLIVLIVHAGMKAQLTIGIYLTLGGGAIFAIGLVLSLFRDRLLSLPDRIRAREGIYRVLNWR